MIKLGVLLAALLIASPALADRYSDCNNVGKRNITIAGCSAIILNTAESLEAKIKAYVKRGNAYLMGDDNDLAIADFDSALVLAPGLPVALYRRGKAKLKKNLDDEAIADFDAVIQTNPFHAFAKYMRGRAKEKKGDKAGAKKDINDALGLNLDIKAAKKDKERLDKE